MKKYIGKRYILALCACIEDSLSFICWSQLQGGIGHGIIFTNWAAPFHNRAFWFFVWRRLLFLGCVDVSWWSNVKLDGIGRFHFPEYWKGKAGKGKALTYFYIRFRSTRLYIGKCFNQAWVYRLEYLQARICVCKCNKSHHPLLEE